MPAAGSGGASVSEGQLALKQKLQVSCANVPTMRPCPVVMLKQGAGLFVRLWAGVECVASRAPTPLSVDSLWQLAGWVRPSDVLLQAQVDFHFEAQQLSRELRQVYASSKARPRCLPVRRTPRMLPGWVERTRHRPVRTPSSSFEELLTDEAMARRRGRVRAPASAGGGSTTHVFRRRCSSGEPSDVIRSRIVGTGRANSLGPSARLPSGNSQPPQVRKVGAGQQKPWTQKAFDSTLGYPGEGPGVQLCYAFKNSGKCKRGTNCPFVHELEPSGGSEGKGKSSQSKGSNMASADDVPGSVPDVTSDRPSKRRKGSNEGRSESGVDVDQPPAIKVRAPLSKKPCFEYQSTGSCRYGANCKFRHDLEPEESRESNPRSRTGRLLAASHRRMQEAQWNRLSRKRGSPSPGPSDPRPARPRTPPKGPPVVRKEGQMSLPAGVRPTPPPRRRNQGGKCPPMPAKAMPTKEPPSKPASAICKGPQVVLASGIGTPVVAKESTTPGGQVLLVPAKAALSINPANSEARTTVTDEVSERRALEAQTPESRVVINPPGKRPRYPRFQIERGKGR